MIQSDAERDWDFLERVRDDLAFYAADIAFHADILKHVQARAEQARGWRTPLNRLAARVIALGVKMRQLVMDGPEVVGLAEDVQPPPPPREAR